MGLLSGAKLFAFIAYLCNVRCRIEERIEKKVTKNIQKVEVTTFAMRWLFFEKALKECSWQNLNCFESASFTN